MLESFCGGRLFAERVGTGPVEVIGLHGWARTRADLVRALPGVSLLAFDLPGFGTSPDPPGAWSSADYAELLAEALSGLDRPQVLVGHSFGGRIAVRLAASRPEAVSGLVLAGVPLFRREGARSAPARRFRIARWGHRHGLVSEARMEKLRNRFGSEDYRQARGVMRAVLVQAVSESYEEDLTRITCPLELVWGANDTVTPLEFALRAAELMPDAHLEVIEGGGHLSPVTTPGALRAGVARLTGAGKP